MARRGAPSAQPVYLPHPTQKRALEDPNESSFSKFLRAEIYAPEKVPGNLSILTGVAMFAAGVAVVRTWGELMIPA
ncbi:hypothetical protein M378DRAFT_186516 [Amanita muscaria Koide BX008]|uniref:Uncharacterized protein n=1 Tax=Amanita muscaria (strain Koide BX008) TaxID=946122 RepID=A0A0C2X921_AMAMK|nr:hypothetical protein M378DRAFT_186516 [Amanita muscaria Koide BX008]